MSQENKYIKIIRDSGLIHASSRKLSLLTSSCIFFSYVNILKKKVGYSYKNLGVVGEKDEAQFLINEDEIGKSFSRMLSKKRLTLLIREMQKEFRKNKQLVRRAKKEKDYFRALEVVLNMYPQVLSQIGFYNSMMRYVKSNQNRVKKLGGIISLVAKDRDIVAKLIYLEIEPLIKRCVNKIGRILKIKGDLLRYMTLKELKKFIKEKKISKKKIAELSKRRKNCLYLFCENKEYITSDKKIIDGIRDEFISIKSNRNVLRGATAYPGKVVGRVYKTFHGVKVSKPGHVLVTSITKPENAPLLKKFAAIVTNEGGVLSHVAVFAREFKIPSVMATKIATKVLKDGQLVEVDANKGVVKIIKE